MDSNTTAVEQGVQVTTDYSQFKYILNNRDRNRGHIEALKKAFVENGNLTKVQPILVNERMEIIDGQHRFVAAKELGEPIYYTVWQGLGINDARQMNILHRSWTSDDFAQSYADGGDGNYKRYLDLREEYGYNHSITLACIAGAEIKGAFAGFRQGEFVLTPEQYQEATKRLEQLSELEDIVPMTHQREFVYAFLKALDAPGYSQKRMVDKLTANAEMVRRYGSVQDYLRMLEEIYNYKMGDANRVRLY
jgi:hypothetical protein